MERADGVGSVIGRVGSPSEPFDQPVDRWGVVRAYLLLSHPVPIAVVLGATLAFALLFGGGSLSWATAAFLILAMLGGQLAIGALNELIDVELDAVAKPWKPIPAGRVSRRGARLMVGGGLALMVLFGAPFGPVALLLLIVGTGLGFAYDLWFKRTLWAWLPYVLALPLLPIWVRTALGGFDPRLLLLFPIGVGAVVGVHLAQGLPDCDGDRAAGLLNPVSRLGERRSLVAACLLVASAPIAALLVSMMTPGIVLRSAVVAPANALSLGLVIGLAAIYRWRPVLGVRAAFPCLALATVVMALGWVIAAG